MANDWTIAFAICLYGDRTPCSYNCWPSTTPMGAQGGMRHSVLQGILWDRSLGSWMFLGTDFMISIFASSHMEGNIKSLHGDIRSSWLTKNLLNNDCLMVLNSPFTETLYIDLPPLPLWSSLSELSDTASWAMVLILPQIKLNSLLSSCTSFFSWHG